MCVCVFVLCCMLQGKLAALLGSPSERKAGPSHVMDMDVPACLLLPLIEDRYKLLFVHGTPRERLVLSHVMARGLAPGTFNNYMSAMRQFVGYCVSHQPVLPFMPATREAVLLFLADLAVGGSRGTHGFMQIVSAINTIHIMLGAVPPFSDRDRELKLFMGGFQRLFVPMQAGKDKVPLLADHVMSVVEYGLQATSFTVKRVCVAVMLGFLLFLRGTTVAHLLVEDVVLAADNFQVSARVLKGENTGRVIPAWTFYTQDCPQVLQLLSEYLQAKKALLRISGPLLFGNQPGVAVTEADVDRWVQHVLGLIQVPNASEFTSHSMRVGGCSAASSLGVPRSSIRIWGRWLSDSMLDVYIRPVPPSPHSASFFKWMCVSPPVLHV